MGRRVSESTAIVSTLDDRLTYHDVLARDLQVMDASAISLSRENRIPIIVFSIHDRGALAAVLFQFLLSALAPAA